MSAQIIRHERLRCPEQFNRRLGEIFGRNRFGEPFFRFIWGQTETYDISTLHGYSKKLIGHGEPCWIVQKWLPPEMFGIPEMYYYFTRDPDHPELAMLGEYPQFGRYETVTPLRTRRYDQETNSIVVETLPLDWDMVERVIPVLIAAQELTYWQAKAAQQAMEEEENLRVVMEIADRMDDARRRLEPTSYRDQQNRTALIDRKMAEIEQQWKRMGVGRPGWNPPKGFFQN